MTSTFWGATHLFPRAELAIIPTMKEEIQGYHMNPNYKKLVHPVQRNLWCHVVATVFFGWWRPPGQSKPCEPWWDCLAGWDWRRALRTGPACCNSRCFRRHTSWYAGRVGLICHSGHWKLNPVWDNSSGKLQFRISVLLKYRFWYISPVWEGSGLPLQLFHILTRVDQKQRVDRGAFRQYQVRLWSSKCG